jgi:uncharacterized protein
MLKLDLGRLEQLRRLAIEGEIAPGDPVWAGMEAELQGPVTARLDAQQAGADVVVRGRVAGSVALECRRCLKPLVVPVETEVTLLFRAGVDEREAEDEEVYALPARGGELDLREPLREQFLLALPQFVVCDEGCRGLCPTCGVDRNEVSCDCSASAVDERWGPLRRLEQD